jgi:hypothetical protein
VLVSSATKDGRLQLAALELGDGGVAPPVAAVPSGGRVAAARAPEPGRLRTPGGVVLEALVHGVKLTFPSGRELLVSPTGRLHLRSGERTLPFLRGVRLLLADDTAVTMVRGAAARQPLAAVDVVIDGRNRRIWTGTRRVVNASHTAPFRGTTLLALGDGGVLYTASGAGPVFALTRVLCPQQQVDRFPPRRVVVVGDVLAASMQLLPAHAPRRSVQFPQVEEAAQRFAALGASLFQHDSMRPPGAVGELWLPLTETYRLKIATNSGGVILLGLYGAGSAVPGVEWTVTSRTEIHFVRPTGGLEGGPRYFMRGIDLREQVKGLLPIPDHPARRLEVSQVIEGLGGRVPKSLEVKRRSQ